MRVRQCCVTNMSDLQVAATRTARIAECRPHPPAGRVRSADKQAHYVQLPTGLNRARGRVCRPTGRTCRSAVAVREPGARRLDLRSPLERAYRHLGLPPDPAVADDGDVGRVAADREQVGREGAEVLLGEHPVHGRRRRRCRALPYRLKIAVPPGFSCLPRLCAAPDRTVELLLQPRPPWLGGGPDDVLARERVEVGVVRPVARALGLDHLADAELLDLRLALLDVTQRPRSGRPAGRRSGGTRPRPGRRRRSRRWSGVRWRCVIRMRLAVVDRCCTKRPSRLCLRVC